ncbi:MAG: hypothetical protein ACXWCG_04460 [Flavitalea sp.]
MAGKQKVRFELYVFLAKNTEFMRRCFGFDDTNVKGIFATSKPSFDVFNYPKPSFNQLKVLVHLNFQKKID